jgi:RNA polymerase-binding transcription factor DksA
MKAARTSKGAHSATRHDLVGSVVQRTQVPQKWLKYYKRLLHLRERFLKDRAELREEAITELPVEQLHPADAATDEFDHDLAWSLLSSEQNALYEIDGALRRIQDGSYGTCEATGQRIPRQRLDVIPWTRFSVGAEKKLESEHAIALPHIAPAHSVTGQDQIRSSEGPGQIEVKCREREPTKAELSKQLEEQALEEEEEEPQ